jgi:regulator of cell morphogenesis and NO signaling
MMEDYGKKTIAELIEENHQFAFLMHFYGMSFVHFPDGTFGDLCKQYGYDPQVLIERFKAVQTIEDPSPDQLQTLPLDLVLEYLRHQHYTYIKQRLPYLAAIIKDLPEDIVIGAEEIQLIFPFFMEDFIHHMYEEEDTLFRHIQTMTQALDNNWGLWELHLLLEQTSVNALALKHTMEDDDMEGIRQLTLNYAVNADTPLALRVVFLELKAMEKDLKVHARIENEILFPKAMQLEQALRDRMRALFRLN